MRMLSSQCSNTLLGQILFSNRSKAQVLKGALPCPQEMKMQVMILSKALEKGLGWFHDRKNNMIKKEVLEVLNIK